MADIIKDAYFALEDKWYGALDWMDQRKIPIYKLVDPVDKVIPSFALFVLLVVLGGLFLFNPLGGLLQGENISVTFQIVDKESSPLPNVPVSFSYNGKKQTLTSDALGQIELSVPSGTKIDYEIDTQKYEIVKNSFTPSGSAIKVIQLNLLQEESLTKTIKLINTVGQPVLNEATLMFSCSTAYGTPPNTISGSGGTFVVTPNEDCLPLIVSVDVQGYESVQSFKITKDVQPIVLQERTIKDATIIVNVKDQSGSVVSNILVTAQTNGIEADTAFTDALGTAILNVSAGTYTVVVSDSLGVYSSAQETISVESNGTATVTLIATKNAAGKITVLVEDKDSKKLLSGAIVKLKHENTILQTMTTGEEGKTVIPISDKTLSYIVSASKEGYIADQQNVSPGTDSVKFGLEKFNGTNGATLKVWVKDQDGEQVQDAKVVLYNADTGFLAPYESKLTDSNGLASFPNVVTGNYKAFAYKAGLSGFGNEQFFAIDEPDTHVFNLTLNVPDGTVSVHVVDKDGFSVSFAKVSLYNAFRNELLGSDLTDTNGMYILPRNNQKSKADKDVYLVVSKAQYSTVTTIQKPILPETNQRFEVVLNPIMPVGDLKIDFIGLFLNDKIVTSAGKNKDYTARFRVSIPEEHSQLNELTVHIRTGEKDIVEKDEWFIKEIKFPKTIVVKGSSWNPSNGVNVDGESITFSEAKWANAVLRGLNPGVYEFEAIVHVRDTALPQDVLKLFYKAMAENDEILRDPFDSNPIDELYAGTKSASYQVGVTGVCDSSFCFDSSILDIDDEKIEDVTEQYNASVSKEYKLVFNLLNNGNDYHTNSNLRIKASNEGITFKNYEIYNADNQKLSGSVNGSEFQPLEMGNFTPQKKAGGNIYFKPNTAGTSIISFELVSDFKTVFSKTIQINSFSNQNIKAEITPKFYPSNVQLDIKVHAEDEGNGNELDGAFVSIENNLGITLDSETTDKGGNATLTLPMQLPGKKLLLKVEKAEYNPFVEEINIAKEVISVSPEKIGINLNVKTQAEKTTPFTITNLSSLPVTIKKIIMEGNLKGLLDKEKMNQHLNQFTGLTISPNGQLDATIKTVATPEALLLLEHDDLSGVLTIDVENYGSPWTIEKQVTYSIGVSSEVDNPTCLTVLPNAWKTQTEGQTVTFEFDIQNNCSINGNPASLQNLKAQAEWKGNELGNVILTVFKKNDASIIGAANVRSGYFSTLLTQLEKEETLTARLDFTPFGGVKGMGTFDIIVQAENPLEGKTQLLMDTVNAEIAVVNLSDCVSYDKEILYLTSSDKTGTFTIQSKGCGSQVDVLLQSDLEISPKEFTLQGDDQKEIMVSPEGAELGQYPIFVKLEGNEQKLPVQQKTVRVRINDPNACLQLNRYEFDVYDDPKNINDGFDTARLENYCTQQKVQIKIKVEKSFMDSLKKGLGAGIAAFVGTGVGNWIEDGNFFPPKNQNVSSDQNNSANKQIKESILGGAIGGALGKIGGELSLGTNNPFVSFGVTTLAVAALDYFFSDDIVFSATVLGKDVIVSDLKVIAGEKNANDTMEDMDIKVERTGNAIVPKINLERETVGKADAFNLTFTNISGFANDILYRNLLVLGKRFEYIQNATYKNKIPDENKLKVNEEKEVKAKFHLQFNSIPPESFGATSVPPIALSCDTFSQKTGKTGALAKPKIKLAWNFQDVSINECDQGIIDGQGNSSYSYCDATQFSIETIKKVQLIKEFIEDNSPLTCPTQDQQSGTKTQTIEPADIGISSISIDKTGTKDINVIVGVENKSPSPNHSTLKIQYKLKDTSIILNSFTKNIVVPTGGSKISIGFPFSNLGEGTYTVNAILTPEDCEDCFNSITANDTIETEFTIGTGSGLVACEPISTRRMGEFISASEQAGQNISYPNGLSKEEFLGLISFQTHLMRDRFSSDFFNDFDRYAKTISFFDAPTYYLDEQTGLHRFFQNREKWMVNREGSPANPEGYLLPGAGIYDVLIDITFDDMEMNFFQNGEPDAVIFIYVEKTSTLEETSPFYSMPFNGLIGTDDGKGRVGYGTNYEGEKVVVNTDITQQVSTIDITNSTPIATIETSTIEAFNILNSIDRGDLLTLTKTGTDDLKLKWSPSYATPILMGITSNNLQSDAYGYYSIGVNNDTSQSYIGAQGNPWYGVGVNCRDFSDNAVLDYYNPKYDTSAINADCALVGPQENIAYGFEWCGENSHAGTTALKTIFYTPQNTLSRISKVAYKDELNLIGEKVSGNNIPLNGSSVISGNSIGDEIKSIEQILQLVEEEAVCVRSSGAETEFFWNPKEIFNAIEKEEKKAISSCIVK